MIKKSFLVLSYVIIAILLSIYGEQLLHWLQSGGTHSLILTSVAATMFALFPVIPYPVIGGILGAAYGPWVGSGLTWLGSSLASIIMFSAVRYGFQDWGRSLLYRYKQTATITHLFERNAFMTIFISRLIPVIPSIVVNIYSALSRVPFWPYACASSLGKIPSMFLFAVVGNSLVTSPRNLVFICFVYAGFLLVVYLIYRFFNRHAAAVDRKPL
ncbi:TVP38/TMEM64 family protein [Alkalihalobacillus oceani]|uniref:TVP38/TMEM64 family protein n=1 Tax=Halalkalibacter oceani TaxID=1653776 RepID=UPI00203C1E79|nr:TVP38/TMEM64 family protein [Halalkalibacter oceani]MCM3760702.1 TVP38/TMEM64 family protein [Halalkalibacter oceani]